MFIILLEDYQFLALLVLLFVAALLFYYLAVRSRKKYRCLECKEEIESEYLESENCNICGAELVLNIDLNK